MTGTAQANTTPARIHEIHRWLNPFRVPAATIHTDLSPHNVRLTLRSRLYEIPWHTIPDAQRDIGALDNAEKIALRERNRGRRWLHVEFESSPTGTILHLRLARSKLDVALWALLIAVLIWLAAALGAIALRAIYSAGEFDRGLLLGLAPPAFVVARLLADQWEHQGDLGYYHDMLTAVLTEPPSH